MAGAVARQFAVNLPAPTIVPLDPTERKVIVASISHKPVVWLVVIVALAAPVMMALVPTKIVHVIVPGDEAAVVSVPAALILICCPINTKK